MESITVASNGLTAVLRRIKACSRCPIPNTDQVTGERRGHVLKALAKLGRNGRHLNTDKYGSKIKPFFTQNFVIELPEPMEEGQVIRIDRNSEVQVAYSDTANWARAA